MNTIPKSVRPIEGEWFTVNYLTIDRKQFEAPRLDEIQEGVRKSIVATYNFVEKHLGDFHKPFDIFIPPKTWDYMTIYEMLNYSETIGDYISTGIETRLMWSQMLANGLSWADLCNNPDNLEYYRIVEWVDGLFIVTGGSKQSPLDFSATHLDMTIPQQPYFNHSMAVPQITRLWN